MRSGGLREGAAGRALCCVIPDPRPDGGAPPTLRSRRRRWLGLAWSSCARRDRDGPVRGPRWIASARSGAAGEGFAFSTPVVDRDGPAAGAADTTLEGRWRLPAGREEVDPRLPRTAARLRGQAASARIAASIRLRSAAPSRSCSADGRIISGASTITMQVARLARTARERSAHGEAAADGACASSSRARLGKTKSLRLSLQSRAAMAAISKACARASLAYFGKELRRLTLGEAALLVALPQSPEQRRPDRLQRTRRAMRASGCSIASPPRALVSLGPRLPARKMSRCRTDAGRCQCWRRTPADAVVAADRRIAALHRPDHRRGAAEEGLEDLARERARALGPISRSLSCAVDHAQPARCSRGSSRRITSISAAPDRSI